MREQDDDGEIGVAGAQLLQSAGVTIELDDEECGEIVVEARDEIVGQMLRGTQGEHGDGCSGLHEQLGYGCGMNRISDGDQDWNLRGSHELAGYDFRPDGAGCLGNELPGVTWVFWGK
ncbi:MAG: hypothetical protein H0U76_19445 [Ktedonobacteraceae bacterium]|nr:hypothetical protein [Ktedonobacteraceae bacterium]